MTREKRIKKSVEKLTIMDDTLFEKMAEDIGFCEELISTVLQQKVKVISAMPQKSVKNLQGRSVRLDLLCVLENGIEEIYVNTKVDDGTDISELMKIFKSRSKYDFKKFPNTSKRKSYFLKNERGRKVLCKVVDECVKEEAKEIAANLFRNGANFDLVRKSIRQLSDEELKEIYEDVKERSFTHK